MREVTIEPAAEGKGRSFCGVLLSYIEADAWWASGSAKDVIRPVWAAFAASEGESRPFVANLRLGRLARPNAKTKSGAIELMRSADYEFLTQKLDGVVATTVYLPELFAHDPGMVDPTGIKFIIAIPEAWEAEHAAAVNPADAAAATLHVARLRYAGAPDRAGLAALIPAATLFNSFLDRRTRCPLIPDLRFQLQIFIAALTEGVAQFPSDSDNRYRWSEQEWGSKGQFKLQATGLAEARIARVVGMNCPHERLEKFLAANAKAYFDTTKP